ncbi:hypothetical protein U1Q18_010510 [Sarracenia purpurea var. burkii]
MEKKQLDLDQPLLSVRRFSSTLSSSNGANNKNIAKSIPHRQHSLPLHKSEWEVEEVTEPATVPFLWEKVPGRPKGGCKAEAQFPVESSYPPRLPPGRSSDVPRLLLEAYKDQNVFDPQIEESPLDNTTTLWEGLKKEVNSESDDDGFSDALDTLSMNHSISDLSGSDVMSSGIFSADTRTCDFMMNRFLPAAKAMVLDMPQSVSKKQLMTPKRPRQDKKLVGCERRSLQSAVVPYYDKYIKDAESEDEDEDDECAGSGKKSVKVFGLFSRFCIKNSLCLLNPVPGMKANKTQVPTSSAKKVGNRLTRTSYSGPLTQMADKNSWGAAYKQKLDCRSQSHQLHKVKSKPTGESNRLNYSADLGMMHGSYSHRCFLGVTNDVEALEAIKMSGSIIPTVEKRLYIDSVDIVKLQLSETISSGAENLKDSSGKTFASSVDGNTSSALISNVRRRAGGVESLSIDHAQNQQSGSLDCSKADDQGNHNVSSMLSTLPPPLPKSPSESWLWRTVPSTALRHPFSRSTPLSQFDPRKKHSKASNMGTKWETIVKTSNVHHDHVRYSEELVAHVSQHSKT